MCRRRMEKRRNAANERKLRARVRRIAGHHDRWTLIAITERYKNWLLAQRFAKRDAHAVAPLLQSFQNVYLYGEW